jgi:hypothetical protein
MTATATPNGVWGWLLGKPRAADRPAAPAPPIRIEPFGREHCGKTALESSLFCGPLCGAQASGLELTASDPRVYNHWLRQSLERYRDLQQRGLASTAVPTSTDYILREADTDRAVLQWRDTVGQLLSHTTPESPADQQARWAEGMKVLGEADVLLPLVNCPPTSASAELARFQANMQLQALNLREALARRPEGRPVALGIVVNKLDTAFGSEDEARKALPDARLRAALGPLVRLAEGSAKVGLAAIIPMTAFGFGTAAPMTPEGDGRGGAGFSPLSEGEVEWRLKPDAVPQPFNLMGLVWWSLMAGLMLRPADGQAEENARVAKLLADDLREMAAWVVPLDCRRNHVVVRDGPDDRLAEPAAPAGAAGCADRGGAAGASGRAAEEGGAAEAAAEIHGRGGRQGVPGGEPVAGRRTAAAQAARAASGAGHGGRIRLGERAAGGAGVAGGQAGAALDGAARDTGGGGGGAGDGGGASRAAAAAAAGELPGGGAGAVPGVGPQPGGVLRRGPARAGAAGAGVGGGPGGTGAARL